MLNQEWGAKLDLTYFPTCSTEIRTPVNNFRANPTKEPSKLNEAQLQ